MKADKIKSIIKLIIAKIPVFLFCVLFIKGYNALFDEANSIVGVILLMGLLMFLQIDFGMDAKYSGLLIPPAFIAMGLFAKISLINPFIGLVVNFIIMGTLLLFSRKDLSHVCYLPFMMGYLMFRGYDVSGDLFVKRMISLVIVGCLIGLIHWLLNRKNGEKEKPQIVISKFSIYNPRDQWAVMLLVTLTIAMFFGDIFGAVKSMWINLSILSLITPLEEDIRLRRRSRIPATILGCAVFIALFGYIIPSDYQSIAVLIGGFISMFITSYFIKTIYNSFNALVTATLLLLASVSVLVRIINNFIGVGISLISMFAFKHFFAYIGRKKDAELCSSDL